MQTSEIRVKGIRVRYAKFMTLLSIFKGTVNMNKNSLENCKMGKVLVAFQMELYLSTFLHFNFSEICGIVDKVNKSKIYSIYNFTEYF